jgi:hypothetical protein
LSCYPIAVERGWMTRLEAAARTLVTLQFFWNSPQGHATSSTGYNGFYYHFLDWHSDERVWQSELSLIDSALLLAGVLTAQTYFSGASPAEYGIRELADNVYGRMDWRWARNSGSTVAQGWKPECGFLHYGWEGYSEATILYVLGLASPTHPLPTDSYTAWTSTYQWENIYGHDCLYAGPLFVHQLAHCWIDFKGIRDQFMREKRSDYFENTRAAAWIQRDYALRNPHEYQGYGKTSWGFSAGDGPRSLENSPGGQRYFGYAARGAPYGPDDGTISPPAVVGSLPFAPEIALPTLRQLCERNPRIALEWRMPSGWNPTLQTEDSFGWNSTGYFGLDQGLIVMMIENYRSQFTWNLMRRCPWIRAGLKRAGFTGGWLRGPRFG